MSPGRRVTIEVFDEEYVARRGTGKVHWFVRVNDAWLGASRWTGAVEERLDPGPGVVYRTRLLLEVSPGTRLMRVESKPGVPRRADTLEHFMKAPAAVPRTTIRRYYAVNERGILVLEPRAR